MRKFLIYFFILGFFLSGCTVIPTSLSTMEHSDQARKYLKKNSMIYGRLVSESIGSYFYLQATHQGTKHMYTIMAPPAMALFSKHKEDNRDGYFFSVLPAGDYKITSITFGDAGYSGSAVADMSFTVPEHSAVYLGTVMFLWETTNNYLLFQKGNLFYDVKDERDEAIRRLWRRFPELKEEGLPAVVNLIDIKDGQRPYEGLSAKEGKKEKAEAPEDGAGLEYQPLRSMGSGGQ